MTDLQIHRPGDDSLRTLTLVVYGLYGLSLFIGVTAIVAIVVNYIKREDVAGTLYESHFRWQMRTFWFSVLWGVLAGLTFWFGLGLVIGGVAWIWYIYRVVKGFLFLNDNKPMPY
ncbi:MULTISPECIES: DUF4870 family protein [Microvirgula]|uniref:Transmembrane protein n=1 Tax=Microvirgula aerodenitrificans TaxID=57480 RepID=A0A2S0PDM3_9NEIS|nr:MULTISPECIES: hypothetical protein [Microvirgula]AVY95461.1 hypothetical protein DAI18_16445 [Microvirgula aerodenitrificans]RAS14410.1 putative membrane protein [Microvirgula sp. AG722]